MTLPSSQLAPATEVTGDVTQNSIQATVRRIQIAVNSRGGPPNVLDAVTFTAGGQQQISHKLGRQPLEWSVADVSGGYGVFQRLSWDDTFVTFQSQNACIAIFKIA